VGEFFKKEEGRKGKGEVICGWSCYRSFSLSLMFTILVVFRFFLRKWVGGSNFNGFFSVSVSLSLSVSLSAQYMCSVCGEGKG